MTRCAVLLRGVNVGRGNRLAMADLRALLERLGADDVTTLLNSGNALVTAEPDGLAGRVEAALRDELDLAVPVVVLTADELGAVVAQCPYAERAQAEPAQVHVAYLAGAPDAAAVRALQQVGGGDELAAGPRALYLAYAGRSVDAPLSKALTRADLGTTWTSRNWSTATRLAALA